MSKEVTADPAYLRQLAKQQVEASAQLATATAATDGIAKSVWISHGCYVGAANKKIEEAEAARKAAGEAMQRVSTALAEKLPVAAEKYAATDEASSDNIDKQVLDGGN